MGMLQLELFALRKTVDDGLVDVLREFAAQTPSVDEKMRIGDMHISDWSLFDSPHPLISKQRAELTGIASTMVGKDVRICDAWFHISRTGSAFGRHNHTEVGEGTNFENRLSMVYYVDRGDPDGAGDLRMYEPDMLIGPETGMILIFPAHVQHEVFEYRGQADRIIIGCNLEIMPAA